VVGLGKMGMPMARMLNAASAAPLCFDTDKTTRRTAVDEGLRVAASLADVFAEAEIVILSLPNATIIEAVISEGLENLGDASAPMIIDASTSTAETSRKMAAMLKAAGGGFIDAPVSGGPSGAASGQLIFMVGGATEHVKACQPIFDTLGRKTLHAGDVGAGNTAKIANNLMVAAHFIVARESLALARAAGLDTSDALGVINAATGGSTVTQIHFPTWVVTKAFDSGFTMSLMQKDIGLATALADQLELDLPMARLTSLLWNDANAPAGDLDFTVMGDPDIISNSSGSETRIA